MATIQTMYCHDDTAPDIAVMPSGILGGWDYGPTTSIFGANARALRDTTDNSSSTATGRITSTPNNTTKNACSAQHLSPPLAAQSISAGNWSLGFTIQNVNATATQRWGGQAGLYLIDGTTGAIKTTIFAKGPIGSQSRTSTAILTCYNATVAGGAATVANLDYLCLEIGWELVNTSGATVSNRNGTAYVTRNTAITADAASATFTAQGKLVAPAALTLAVLTKTKSLSGGVSPSGVVKKADTRTFAGTVTSAAALIRQAVRRYTSSSTPAAALTRTFIPGVITISGGGTLTPSGAISRNTALPRGGTSPLPARWHDSRRASCPARSPRRAYPRGGPIWSGVVR